jgi:hypothetical protein
LSKKRAYRGHANRNPVLRQADRWRNAWLTPVEFSFDLDKEDCVDCAGVSIYEPVTKQYRCTSPDDLAAAADKGSRDQEIRDAGSI